MEISAVVNIRKGSRRIPHKNYQLIGKEYLWERKIRQLKNTKCINRVILTSDDILLKDHANKMGAEFYLIADDYADEATHTPNEVIQKVLSNFVTDVVVWAHCTNPFITPELYGDALIHYFTQTSAPGGTNDSLFSTNELQGHFWQKHNYSNVDISINFDYQEKPWKAARNCFPIFEQNGGIFIRPYKAMANDGNFLGNVPYMYKMNLIQGWDIDDPIDLKIAQMLEDHAI